MIRSTGILTTAEIADLLTDEHRWAAAHSHADGCAGDGGQDRQGSLPWIV
jgi:hypothetical protein